MLCFGMMKIIINLKLFVSVIYSTSFGILCVVGCRIYSISFFVESSGCELIMDGCAGSSSSREVDLFGRMIKFKGQNLLNHVSQDPSEVYGNCHTLTDSH